MGQQGAAIFDYLVFLSGSIALYCFVWFELGDSKKKFIEETVLAIM